MLYLNHNSNRNNKPVSFNSFVRALAGHINRFFFYYFTCFFLSRSRLVQLEIVRFEPYMCSTCIIGELLTKPYSLCQYNGLRPFRFVSFPIFLSHSIYINRWESSVLYCTLRFVSFYWDRKVRVYGWNNNFKSQPYTANIQTDNTYTIHNK